MPDSNRVSRLLRRSIQVHQSEVAGLCWSFAYFFCLLAGYYILRPVRDEMAIAGGVQNLPYLFTTTFLMMALIVLPVYGYITSRFPRRRFVPWVYCFFILNLIGMFALFQSVEKSIWVGRVFFVWVSVFNLFVVSIFWSFMADVWERSSATRLFGVIAAGGSAGAATGPLLTAVLVEHLGVTPLLLVSAGFLVGAVVCINRVLAWQHRCGAAVGEDVAGAPPIGGTILAGMRIVFQQKYFRLIALLLAMSTFTGTTLYFARASLVEQAIGDPVQRTTLFAYIDLAVNILTVLIQVFITGRLIKNVGIARTIAILPVIVLLSMVAMTSSPSLLMVALVMILQRAVGFSIAVPSMGVLFTVVSAEAKYKAKHFIDTVCYRLGDVLGAWTFVLVTSWLGLGLQVVTGLAAAVAVAWFFVALRVGRLFVSRGVGTDDVAASREPVPV